MSGKKIIPKNARESALQALLRYECDSAYLNLALPPLLKKLSLEDRALAVQLAAGTIQRLNTLDWALSIHLDKDLDSLTPPIRNILRLGLYQFFYLQRIPDYAVVDQAVRLAHRYGHRGTAGLVNALLRKLAGQFNNLPWPDKDKNPVDYLALTESFPRWIIKRMLNDFSFLETAQWCAANNRKPHLSIRPNRLRISPAGLAEKLGHEGYSISENTGSVPGLLYLAPGQNPAASDSFREGLFTIQGESSALVPPLLEPHPGDTLIDLCSAPGGKTTHLAELIEDCGKVYAVELSSNRLELVRRAAARMGLESIVLLQADGTAIDRSNLTLPDAVLVDAPCSGLGVIRRLPEIKWRRQESDLPGLQRKQLQLLNAAARILPPGGKLLYSVCTTMREETGEVLESFSAANSNFVLQDLLPLLPPVVQEKQDQEKGIYLYPHRHNLDGFFIALWRKKG